jgi:hypothetical protein
MKKFLLLAALLLVPATAHAQSFGQAIRTPVVEQSSALGSLSFWWAQSFVATEETVRSVGAAVLYENTQPIQPFPRTFDTRLGLWSGDPSNGGVELGGNRQLIDRSEAGPRWERFIWGAGLIPLVAGETYWLVFGATENLALAPPVNMLGSSTNSYALGTAFRGGSSVSDSFTSLPDADLSFALYTATDAWIQPPVVPPLPGQIPEPSPWSLVLLGCAALLAKLRHSTVRS